MHSLQNKGEGLKYPVPHVPMAYSIGNSSSFFVRHYKHSEENLTRLI